MPRGRGRQESANAGDDDSSAEGTDDSRSSGEHTPMLQAKVIDHSTLRRTLLGLVAFSVLAYLALLFWGIAIREPQNISEVKGLPTVSDMLAEHLSLTIFFVVMVCLYSEIRTAWNMAHFLNAKNPHMVSFVLKVRRCCCGTVTMGSFLLHLTLAIRIFGLLQVALLILVAVIPVEPPRDDVVFTKHTVVAALMTLASVVHAILLSVRRETVFGIFKEANAENQVFGCMCVLGSAREKN